MTVPKILSSEDFLLFQEYLETETGLFFDEDRDQNLRRALWDRVQKRGYSSYDEYYHYLKYHIEGRFELRELLTLITTGETYFFRNIAQFDVLMRDVLPEIIKRKSKTPNRSIRIWSAGSSKGDEGHSIAIALMQVLPDYQNWNISILGTDINRDVLKEAREAIYVRKDLGELSPDLVERYFVKRGSNYVLSSEVKKLVRFEYHNLAKDPFTLDPMLNLDVIFCRNVTIYFNLDTTRKLVGKFYDCLTPGGYLFLGHAETLWQISTKFQTIEYPSTFIYRKPETESAQPFVAFPDPESLRAAKTSAQAPKAVAAAPLALAKMGTGDPVLDKAEAFYQAKQLDEALALLNTMPGSGKVGMLKARILTDQEKNEEAMELLTAIIRTDDLNPDPVFLL
ncbi:MAG: hypothetical protein HQL19_06330, partial [Candidatus Omnitrophica bacterium]|nr:hypothetical protein [Candidatus Omnitrophota bacterium]